ncbi:hypothetical protein ACQJ1D_25835 [Klebsiella pneumoniae]|uniref:hypothetical protein n=1 Tax=Klebsiella pneumoniae TaxID=573 RepID=UPI003CFCBD1E
MVGYRQTNQKTDTGKTLTRWPVFVDHFIEMTSGSALEGIIPANTDFIVTLQPGDITKFEIIVEDIPREPAIVE